VVDYARPTVTLTGPEAGIWLSGKVTASCAVSAAAYDPIRRVSLELDGEEVDGGDVAAGTFTLDTARFRDGSHVLRATVQTVSGAADTDSRTVYFDNGVGTAMVADARAIAGWGPFPGAPARPEVRGDWALLSLSQGTWGAVESPPFELDFDRSPQVLIDVQRPDATWWFKVRLAGGEPWYIHGDTNAAGVRSISLAAAIRQYQPSVGERLRAKTTATLIVGPSGKPGATVEVRSIRVVYDR